MQLPAALTKKVGPFPVAVYGAAGVAALGIGIYYRKKKGAALDVNAAPNANDQLAALQDSGFAVGEDFPFTFEGPPNQPPTVIVQPQIIMPAVGASPTPANVTPSGQRPQRDSVSDLTARWNAQKQSLGFKSTMNTAQRTKVVNTFLADFNKNRPGGKVYTLADLKKAQSNL